MMFVRFESDVRNYTNTSTKKYRSFRRIRYFLGEEDTSSTPGGLFGLFGGTDKAPASSPVVVAVPSSSNKAAELAAERKKKADEMAAERKRMAEEAASAAREAQAKAMRDAEEKRRAAAAAKGKCATVAVPLLLKWYTN